LNLPSPPPSIAATDANDVASMFIESEGNLNQAIANMLCGAAGVVSLHNNKDSFNEVEALLAQCKGAGFSHDVVEIPCYRLTFYLQRCRDRHSHNVVLIVIVVFDTT
jgi:hypothetical protein